MCTATNNIIKNYSKINHFKTISFTFTSEQFINVRSEAEGCKTGIEGYKDAKGCKEPNSAKASILVDC